jgi:hypothetical protein
VIYEYAPTETFKVSILDKKIERERESEIHGDGDERIENKICQKL